MREHRQREGPRTPTLRPGNRHCPDLGPDTFSQLLFCAGSRVASGLVSLSLKAIHLPDSKWPGTAPDPRSSRDEGLRPPPATLPFNSRALVSSIFFSSSFSLGIPSSSSLFLIQTNKTKHPSGADDSEGCPVPEEIPGVWGGGDGQWGRAHRVLIVS